MRIKDEFYGAVFVHTPSGSVKLCAGDEVPDGVVIDEELVVKPAPVRRPTRGKTRKSE